MIAVPVAQWTRLIRRFLTPAGNQVIVPVTLAATSIAVVFPRAEVDAKYGVLVSVNYLTTVAVTAKTATGCTVTFGTGAPANASIDLAVIRTE